MEAVGGSPERAYPLKDRAQHSVGLFPVRGVGPSAAGWDRRYERAVATVVAAAKARAGELAQPEGETVADLTRRLLRDARKLARKAASDSSD